MTIGRPSQQLADEIRREYEARHGEPRHDMVEHGRVKMDSMALDEPADIGPG